MPRLSQTVFFLVCTAVCFNPAWIEVGVAQGTTAPVSETLVIQPDPSLRALAYEVAGVLSRRTGIATSVGGPAPFPPEAVRDGQLALVPHGESGVLLALGGPDGRTATTTLENGSTRSLALAIEDLNDEVRRPLESGADGNGLVYLDYRPEEAESHISAKPMVYLQLLMGYSHARQRVRVGPGAGFGLCYGMACVALEADFPMLASTFRVGEHQVRYRGVNVSMRLQVRPFQIGDVSFGGTVGILTRILSVSVDDAGVTRGSSFGVRSSLEAAWRFQGPFEWVLEAGLDTIVSSERVTVGGQRVFPDDMLTPWVVMALRMRPRLD